MSDKIRLNKYIASSGLVSRRKADDLIEQGKVKVNGEIISELGFPVSDKDKIVINGELIKPEKKVYIKYYKPAGYITTMSDEKGRPTVADLTADVGVRLYPVGRLDMDSDGLLIMTDDGALANALMHPSSEIGKSYETVVSGDIAAGLQILRAPMELDGRQLSEATVEQISDDTLRITIHEGRNRQVRRMCETAGLKVCRLTRVSEGPLKLGDLSLGTWRYLTENEISMLKDLHINQKIPTES